MVSFKDATAPVIEIRICRAPSLPNAGRCGEKQQVSLKMAGVFLPAGNPGLAPLERPLAESRPQFQMRREYCIN